MLVRNVREADWQEIGLILVKGWQKVFGEWISSDFLKGMNPQDYASFMKKGYDLGKVSFLIAEEENKVRGYVCYGNREDIKKEEKEIISFFVHPDFKNQKIGSILLQELERKVVEEQVKFLFLWTIKENQEARIFYEKRGFLLSSKEQKRSFGPSEVLEVLYEKELLP